MSGTSRNNDPSNRVFHFLAGRESLKSHRDHGVLIYAPFSALLPVVLQGEFIVGKVIVHFCSGGALWVRFLGEPPAWWGPR
jgi:hypothetical protein